MDRLGAVRIGRDVERRGECSVVQVHVPGDAVVVLGGRQHIDVAVAVQIGRVNVPRQYGVGRNRVRPKGAAAHVFVPGDRVVVGRGGKHIEVAVVVQVRRIDGFGPVDAGRDGQFAGKRVAAQVVEPSDRVVKIGGEEHVGVAVAVQVRRVHRAGAAYRGADIPRIGKSPGHFGRRVRLPLRSRACVILREQRHRV